MSNSHPSDEKLDVVLAGLTPRTSADDLFTILQELVLYWHGPIRSGDGIQKEELQEIQLPRPLLKWYEWAGRRSEILSGQNFLLAPDKLRIVDDRLCFYIENQGCYSWATLMEGDDPPVFGRFNNSDPWLQEEVNLSAHLILVCLFEGIMCHSQFSASNAWIDSDKLNRIAKQIPPLAIGRWHWPGTTSFHARRGAFMYVAEHMINGERGSSIWIGAKRAEPLKFLRTMVDERWDYAALGSGAAHQQ